MQILETEEDLLADDSDVGFGEDSWFELGNSC